MPFEFRIRQTGLFRTRLEIDDLTAGVFMAGMHDRFFRFISVIPNEGYVILYDPAHIGTGIRLKWDPEETEEVILWVPALCTVYDIEMLIQILARIMKKWHVKAVSFDDLEYGKDCFDQLKASLTEKTMQIMAEVRSTYDEGITLVHGALWPLMYETAKLRKMGSENDLEGFAELLDACQRQNLKWCACHVYLYDDQKSYQGVYTVSTGVRTIIPVKPMPPVDMIDPATGDDIVCDRYLARIVTRENRRPLLQMEYHKFLEMIHADSLPLYDACHVIYCADQEKILEETEKREELEGRPCW